MHEIHEINLTLQRLMAVTALFPIILMVFFFVKDRLQQWRQDDWRRSDDALENGELEHSVVPEVIDIVQDKRTDEDRFQLLRLVKELEARIDRNVDGLTIRRNINQLRIRQAVLKERVNQLQAELKRTRSAPLGGSFLTQ